MLIICSLFEPDAGVGIPTAILRLFLAVYHEWGPPSLDAAATPSLRHCRRHADYDVLMSLLVSGQSGREHIYRFADIGAMRSVGLNEQFLNGTSGHYIGYSVPSSWK